MRSRRRARRSSRTYSLARLINRQPKSLAKHPHYRTMLSHYHASERLRRLRISRRCYRLMDDATITPRNLANFYRTYRLPVNAFFPLFFAIKRDYLAERDRRREERRRYIVDRMRSLPPPVLAQVKYLGYLERFYNGADESPVWQRELFPGSKKRADAYHRYATADWLTIYRRHVALLRERYREVGEVVCERTLACFALGIVPDTIPPGRPSATEVNRLYRRLSMETHPDRGGDPARFIEIKRARDLLLER